MKEGRVFLMTALPQIASYKYFLVDRLKLVWLCLVLAVCLKEINMMSKTPISTSTPPKCGRNFKNGTPDIPQLKSILKTPNTPRNSSGVHFEPPRDLTGKNF